MKTIRSAMLCILAFAAAAAPALAADPAAPAEPAVQGPPPGPGAGPAGGEGRFGRHDGDHPLERFLEWYRQQNPDDVARLQKLREEDPEAFRAELREKLEKARQRFGEGRAPGMGPGGRRGPGGEGWRGPADGPHGGEGRGWMPGLPEGRGLSRLALSNPEAPGWLDALRKKTEAYRAATDETAKAALKEEIRGLVAKLYEVRIADQAKQLDQLEVELSRLRDEIARRRADFKALVEERVEELLRAPEAPAVPPEAPPPAPPPP
jgi:uncharacterized coiled-coil protein SlyX